MVALEANPDGSGVQILVDGLPAESLLAMDSVRFGSSERPFRVVFDTDGRGGDADGGPSRASVACRASHRCRAHCSRADPDPALAARIAAALAALRQGGAR